MMKFPLLLLVSACFASGLLQAQFLVPAWRDQAHSECAIWDRFTEANFAPNRPDVRIDSPTEDATLTCLTSSAFLTSGGNLYSFSSPLSLQLSDSARFEIRNLALQIGSLGSRIDQASVRLLIPDGSGGFIQLAPTRSFLASQEELTPEGQNQGGVGDLWFYQWDLRQTPIPAGTHYDVLFSSESSSLSLDQLQLDTQDQYEEVPQPRPLQLASRTLGGGGIELRYPAFYEGRVVLEFSATLGPTASWSRVDAAPIRSGDDCLITLTPTQNSGFYRLRVP